MCKNVSPRIFVGIFLIFFLGCKPSSNEEFSSLKGFADSSANTIFKGGINYSAQELPLSQFVDRNSGSANSLSSKNIESELAGELVFQVEFRHLTEEDLLQSKFTNLDYSQSVQYLSSEIASDFFVITSANDTLVSSGVIFERNFNIAPYKRVLVFFSGVSNPDVDLLYNDHLFGNGQILFNKRELNL